MSATIVRAELRDLPACEPDGRHWFWHGAHVLTLLDRYRPMTCVELGTHRGGSAIAVARLIRQWGGTLTCVDVWDGDVSIAECARNLVRANVSASVRLIQAHSQEAAWFWREPIDYCYVDADHTEEGCGGDLCAWWRFLKIGGLIAGDDYDDPRWGVTAAWDAFERAQGQVFHRLATPGSDPACTRLIWGVKQ